MMEWIDDWKNRFSDVNVPIGQFLIWIAAAFYLTIVGYSRLPVLKAGASNMYTFITIVPTVKKIETNLEKVRRQVENSHTTNLRDDLDEKWERSEKRDQEIVESLRSVRAQIQLLDERDLERGKELRTVNQRISKIEEKE